MTYERFEDTIAGEVTALEREIRAHVVDLDEAFSMRDWAGVARIYRQVAALADRLEELDPAARSRWIERAEREQAARDAAWLAETDELDELAMRGEDALETSRFLEPPSSAEPL